MPEISRFYGILILMLYSDHNPPHFHAKYGEYEVTVDIETGIVTGSMPKRALSLILEWYEIHIDELKEMWKLAESRSPLKKVPPLP